MQSGQSIENAPGVQLIGVDSEVAVMGVAEGENIRSNRGGRRQILRRTGHIYLSQK